MDNMKHPVVSTMRAMYRTLCALGIEDKTLCKAYLVIAGLQLQTLMEGKPLMALEYLRTVLNDIGCPSLSTLERLRHGYGIPLTMWQIVMMLVGAGLAQEG